MSGDHNQFQKPKSYLDDMNEVRKVLEMALMALEDANDMFSDCSVEDVYADEIDALTKVLEKESFECPRCGHCCQADQPTQQEPVAWMHTTGTGHVYFRKKPQDKVFNPQPVFTSPPKKQWVGLKDEQVEDEWERITGHSIFGGDRSEGRAMYISPDEVIEFSRYIEAKLKEKNDG